MDELNPADPNWLLLALLVGFITGMVLLRWGKRLPRKGDWLAVLAVLVLLTAAVAVRSLDTATKAGAGLKGWVWPRAEDGAILVGFFRDPLSLIAACLAALIVGFSTINRVMARNEPRAEKLHAASAIALSGVTLAWHAHTAWLGFAGIMIAVFAGFVAQGVRWGDDAEAGIASRYAGERATGWVLALLGAAALSSAGAKLFVGDAAPVSAQSAAIGAWLLAFGLSIQLQPFPFLGWISMRSEAVPVARVIYSQILPGLATFAVLIRFSPVFEATSVFPVFAWVMAGSSVLSSLAGLLQSDWRRALGFWVAAAFALCFAATGVSEAPAAVALLAGTALAGTAFAWIGSTGSEAKHANWSRAALILAASVGTGMIGFVSCGGYLSWLRSSASDPPLLAAMAFVHLMSSVLAWKLAWMVPSTQRTSEPRLAYNLLPLLAIIGALGMFWNGTVTGGAIPGAPDALLESLLALAFPKSTFFTDDGRFIAASWAHWGTLAVAFSLAYATHVRGEDKWQRFEVSFPRVGAFIRSGYGVDFAARRILFWVGALGASAQQWVDLRFWRGGFPSAMRWILTRSSIAGSRFSGKISSALNSGVYRATDVPAKMLQLIQSGDVQWYLFFAIGSGIVMLIHFLRFQ